MNIFQEFEPAIDNGPPPPGLVYVPDFISESDEQSFINILDGMEWNNELQRRVQHYGYRYDYRARGIDTAMRLGSLPEFSLPIQRKMLRDGHLANPPDQLIVNEYIPGQGISAHTDCIGCFQDRIAAVSLGWAYELDFIHAKSGRTHSMILDRRSLLVLSGEVRYDWLHRIRARRSDYGIARKRRISMTFRSVIPNWLSFVPPQ